MQRPEWLMGKGFVELSDEAVEASRWAARGLAAFALAVFAVLLLERGAPRSMSETAWESTAQYAVLGVVALGSLLAWKWEGLGGWVLTTASVALGVLASIMYEPGIALFGCLAFFVPGALFLIHWQHHHGRLVVAATALGMVALLSTGAVASARVYDFFAGPTHPESHLAAKPVDIAEWVLAGGVDTQGFEVRAKLADPGDGVPDLIVSPLEGDLPLFVFHASEGPSPEGDVVAFQVRGLSAGTEYRYALRLDDHIDDNRAGTVRTMPSGPASFTVALASCSRTGSQGQVFDRIRETQPLLFIQMGDFHYENIGVDDPGLIREAYERALESAPQQALYLSTGLAYTWDDHDFGGNNANRASASKEAVQRVYREFFPHFGLSGGEAVGPIYQAFSAGRVRFILTDTRSERSPVGDTWDADRTMLGADQKEWLKGELLAARDSAGLTIWVNSVPWIAAAADGRDDWGGYAAERQELSDFIAENRITKLAMFSGDAHMLAIDDGSNNVFDSDGSGPGFPVFQAAALDRRGNVKGGPYSEGAYPGGGHFGLMTVTDEGDSISVEWSGRDWENNVLVEYQFEVPAVPH